MKNYLIISLLIFSVGFCQSKKEYHINDLLFDDGIVKMKFSNEIPNGRVYFWNSKNKVYIGNIKNGKQDGFWTLWYENGRKIMEGTFKNGEQDGLHTFWYENGKEETRVRFKNGKQNGLMTKWYENGMIKEEGIFKDGKPEGFMTKWYENGQMKLQGTFKDGKWIDSKKWNEDGSVRK